MARYSRKKRSRRPSSVKRTDAARRIGIEPESINIEKRAPRKSSQTSRQLKRASNKGGGFGGFLRKNIKVVAIAGFVLVVGGIVLGILLSGKNTAPTAVTQETEAAQTETVDTAAVSPEHTDMPEEAFSEYTQEAGYNYDGVDDSVLAGLTGSDDSLFTDMDQEMEDAIFEAEGIRIGVTLGDLNSSTDKQYLSKLEQASNDAEVAKLVYEVYYYNALGDFNQQLQDVRSLIKNEVDVLIIGNTDKEAFDMVQAMAAGAGIPVVAYNAPDGASGYVINVVPDDTQWGRDAGQFVAQNLSEGNVLQVLGSSKTDVDILRAAGISEALAANEILKIEDIVYAKWDEDDAYDAVEEFIDEEGYAAAVIAEEGMAKGVLEAYVDMQLLPKVFCADITAGFIKTWYTLKTKGIDVEIETKDDDEDSTIRFRALPDDMTVLALPAPVNIGAAAFEIAYMIADGRTLINEGNTFVYNYETIITSEELFSYYVKFKDKDDDYVIRDTISEETLESLFNPAEEVTAGQ